MDILRHSLRLYHYWYQGGRSDSDCIRIRLTLIGTKGGQVTPLDADGLKQMKRVECPEPGYYYVECGNMTTRNH